MNRFVLPDDDQSSSLHATDSPQACGITSTLLDLNDEVGEVGSIPSVAHCLFGPRGYEPGYAYPLIVWIHSPDDNERQLNQVMPHISLQNFVGVSPRGTLLQDSYPNGVSTYSWQESPEQIFTALDRVKDCIDLACLRFNIDRSRVFLGGYDVGGTMALRLAWADPGSFAGVASFGGRFPRNHMPLRNFDASRSLPLLLAYGKSGIDYSDTDLQSDLRLLHSAGFQRHTINQYPCADELVTQMLKDFNSWVMKVVNGYDMCETAKDALPDFLTKYESQN